MPVYLQGNIFDAIAIRPTLAIIFGHLGFNVMAEAWGAFRPTIQALENIKNPFHPPLQPIDIGNHRWLWFFHSGPDGGMADADFIDSLNAAFGWAAKKGVRYVITNGIADVGHGGNTELNRRSDDRRTRLLVAYAVQKARARDGGISIELISLNDVFTRNAYIA